MRSPEEAVSPLRRARLLDRCVSGRLRMRLQVGSHQCELALVLGLRLLGGVRPRLQAGPHRRELALVLGPRPLGLSVLSPCLLGPHQRELALVLGLCLLLSVLSPCLFLCLRRSDRGRRAAVQLVVRPVTALCTALGCSAPGYCWRVFGAWRRKKWFVDVPVSGLLAEEVGEDEA